MQIVAQEIFLWFIIVVYANMVRWKEIQWAFPEITLKWYLFGFNGLLYNLTYVVILGGYMLLKYTS